MMVVRPGTRKWLRLAVLYPSNSNRHIDLLDEDRLYLVGKDAYCDLVIEEDPLVSGKHASIRCINGAWYLDDMGSVNGTLVLARRVYANFEVHAGTRIQIGRTILELTECEDVLEITEKSEEWNPEMTSASAEFDDEYKELKLVLSLSDTSPVDELLIKHLPHVVALFRCKARDYAGEGSFTADVLGARGQFAEIWRKVGKLKRSMWDGRKMEFEQTDEILSDLFGHIMLAIDYNDTESKVDKYRGLK